MYIYKVIVYIFVCACVWLCVFMYSQSSKI